MPLFSFFSSLLFQLSTFARENEAKSLSCARFYGKFKYRQWGTLDYLLCCANPRRFGQSDSIPCYRRLWGITRALLYIQIAKPATSHWIAARQPRFLFTPLCLLGLATFSEACAMKKFLIFKRKNFIALSIEFSFFFKFFYFFVSYKFQVLINS